MYRIVLADDEEFVLESLNASINWKDYGFEVIGTAHNGIEALDLIKKLKPDVLFADIRMPGLNGLGLIKKTHELNKNIQCIIISGYAEFAYAQKAMSYGAIGYCLKPFDELEIITMLDKAKNILEKYNKQDDPDLLELIENLDSKNAEKLSQRLLESEFKIYGEIGFYILVVLGCEEIDSGNSSIYMGEKIGRHKYMYFVQCFNHQQLYNELNNILAIKDIWSIGISMEIFEVSHCDRALEKSMLAAYQYFIFGDKKVYQLHNGNNKELDELMQSLEEAVSKKEIGLINKSMDDIGVLFASGKYNIKHAFRLYNFVITLLSFSSMGKYTDYLYSYEQLVATYESFQDMLSQFRELLEELVTADYNYLQGDIKSETLKEIMNYINKNYYKELSLQTIGQQFSLNPTYISYLFKKESGITFTDYLIKLRIEQACFLLKSTDLRINGIAEKVGYNDYYYFAKVFKKTVGVTPSCYRISLG